MINQLQFDKPKMEKLAIIGAGDLGQLMAFYAINEGTYSFVGFYDDLYKTGERKGIGQILGPIDNIEKQFESNIFDRIINPGQSNKISPSKQIGDLHPLGNIHSAIPD